MATVIDKLIVSLGLDPSDFTKGEKEVAASVIQTKDKVKQATNENSVHKIIKDTFCHFFRNTQSPSEQP